MAIYVLIMVMSGYSTGVAIHSQEFSSREKCLAAAKIAIDFAAIQKKASNSGVRLDAMCVEK